MTKRERRNTPAHTADAPAPEGIEASEAAIEPADATDGPAIGDVSVGDDDDWDDPTREVAPEEVAALAVKSTSELDGNDAVPIVELHGNDEQTLPHLVGDPATASEPEALAGTPEVGAAPDGEAAPDLGGAPDVGISPGGLESVIESLLFVSDRPLTLADLKRLTGERQVARLTAAVEALQARRAETGIQVIAVAGGWHLRTHPENVAWVSRLIAGKPVRLSRAMLETLAIVAYRQPVTRPEIDEIRGVDCGPVLGTLLERGLVRIIGKKEDVGRPMLYGTTPEFLRTFSLKDLNELPTLREFHELSEAHRDELAKVDGDRPAEAAPGGSVDGPITPPRRPTLVRDANPAEDDALLEELERASSAATAAATAANPPAEGPLPEAAPTDKPAPSDEPANGGE